MALIYKKATIDDLEILTETRIEVLRAANKLENNVDMSEVKKQSCKYYQSALKENTHLAYLIFDEGTFVETNAYVKAYANELSTADTAEYEGVVCGYGAVDGRLTFVYAQNAARLNGAFSKAAAEKIAALYDMAKKNEIKFQE